MKRIAFHVVLLLSVMSLCGCVGYVSRRDGVVTATGVGVSVSTEPTVRVGVGVFEKRYIKAPPPPRVVKPLPPPYKPVPPPPPRVHHVPSLYPPFPSYYFVPPFPFHPDFGIIH